MLMFWKKNKCKPQKVKQTELWAHDSVVSYNQYTKLDLRRAILDWRDRHIESVEVILTREISVLFVTLDQLFEKMSFNDLLRQKKFGKQQIEPIYREWVDREVTGLIQTAEKDLSRLFVHSLVINEGSGNIAYGTNNDHFTDAAIAAVATGAGIAVAPTFASMSIVSAGGAFGVFGVTAVSWPIIAVGLVTVGGLIALGGHKATHIKSNAIGKIRNNLKDAIRKQVLGYNSKTESVRERLQIQIETIAAKILLEIDLC